MTENVPGYIDLHIHSTCSDGALSVTALVQEACRHGLSAIAIADHDSVSAIAEGGRQAALAGIELIPAVELSVQHGALRDVHLLGYGIDHTDARFRETLSVFRQRREQRNEEILRRVNQRLLHEGRGEIHIDEVLAHAGEAIGRPHIARVLLERGYVKSIEDAFRRYLVPCNVPKCYWNMADALADIRRQGGVSILAHPTSISQNMGELWRIILELRDMGLDGIEVFNNQAQAEEMEYLRRHALEAELLVTGGSDFHGIEAGAEMGKGRGGIRFSSALLAPLKKLLEKRQLQKALAAASSEF